MGLFDIFSGSDAQNAANAQIGGIQNALATAAPILGTGINAVGNAGTTGANAVGNYANTGAGAVGGYAGLGANAIGNYANTGANYLTGYGGMGANAIGNYIGGAGNVLGGYVGQGANALNQYVGSALQPSLYNWGNVAQPGTTALGNALGLNGAQGNAASTQAFWNNPAIQSQLNIGNQNVLRGAAAAGGGNLSGSTLAALQNLGQQTASQGWQNYVSNLNPYLNFGQGTAQNIGNINLGAGTNLSGLYGQAGNTLAGIYGTGGSNAASLFGNTGASLGNLFGNAGTSTGNIYGQAGGNTGNIFSSAGGQTAGIYNNEMNNLSNMYGNLANMYYGGLTSAGNAQANADLANYNASGNIWGALSGGLKSALGSGGLFGAQGALPFLGTLSDERVKDDIRVVGELFDGQPVYRYRYKGSPRVNIGLIAQDVERTDPHAVASIGPLKVVDYGRATDRAAMLYDFAKRADMRLAV